MLKITAILFLAAHTGCGDSKSTAPSAPADAPAAPAAAPAAPPAEAPAAAPAAATARSVSFGTPADGATVASPVHVKMQVQGMEIKPAGEIVEGTGHHHIIVDGGSIPAGQVIPMDATHIHFGKGQTETDLELTPGEHKLTLQFADGTHTSYGPDMSATITVTVEAAKE